MNFRRWLEQFDLLSNADAGWISPEGELFAVPYTKHLDFFRRYHKYDKVLDRIEFLEKAERLQSSDFYKSGGRDHEYNSEAQQEVDSLKGRLVNTIYAEGWVRIGIWDRTVYAEGTKEGLARNLRNIKDIVASREEHTFKLEPVDLTPSIYSRNPVLSAEELTGAAWERKSKIPLKGGLEPLRREGLDWSKPSSYRWSPEDAHKPYPTCKVEALFKRNPHPEVAEIIGELIGKPGLTGEELTQEDIDAADAVVRPKFYNVRHFIEFTTGKNPDAVWERKTQETLANFKKLFDKGSR